MKPFLSIWGERSMDSPLDGLPVLFPNGTPSREIIVTRDETAAQKRSISPSQAFLSGLDFTSLATGASIVSRTEAWRNPHVRACVEANSQAIASLDFAIYKGEEKQKKHWWLDFVEHPNEFVQMSGHDLKMQTVAVREMFGETFWFLDREDTPSFRGTKAPVAAIWIYHPQAVAEAIDTRTGLLLGWEFAWESQRFFVDREDVIHFKRYDPLKHNPRRPSRGSSPLDAAMLAVSAHYAADRFNLDFFSRGIAPGIVLTSKEEIEPNGEVKLREKLRAQNVGKNGEALILDGGEIEIHQLSTSQRDSEFIAGKKMAMAEICEVFKTPPCVVGNQDQKYDNAEMQLFIWWDIPLASIARNVTDGVNLGLLKKEPGVTCWLDTSNVAALQKRKDSALERYLSLVKERHSPKVASQMTGVDVDPTMPGYEDVLVSFSQIPYSMAIEGKSAAVDPENPIDQEAKPGDKPATTPKEEPAETPAKDPAPKREPVRFRVTVPDPEPTRIVRIAPPALTRSTASDDILQLILKIVTKDTKRIQDKARQFQLLAVKAGAQQIGISLQLDAILAIDDPRIVAFIEQRGNLITSVPEGVAIRITNKTASLIEKGTSPEDIGTILRKDFNVLSDYKARQIGRQEVGSALNGGRHIQMEAEGVDGREWLNSKDDRVRDSHVKVDGEIVGRGERYSNGLLYPQDPEGDPSETIECRCIELPAPGGSRSLAHIAHMRGLAAAEIRAAAANGEQIDERTASWRAVVRAKDVRKLERQMADAMGAIINGWRAPILEALAGMGVAK